MVQYPLEFQKGILRDSRLRSTELMFGSCQTGYQAFPPSTWVRGEGGEDRNAQEKCQVQHVLGFFLRFMWLFSKMFVAWRDKHQNKKGAKVPTFPFLVVWTEKCVSGVIFWRAWGSKKRGFDCIFAVFYCFPRKSYFFDIKHAKCDLTVKSQ